MALLDVRLTTEHWVGGKRRGPLKYGLHELLVSKELAQLNRSIE